MEYDDLIRLTDSFPLATSIPLCLVDETHTILHQTSRFPKLPETFFQTIFARDWRSEEFHFYYFPHEFYIALYIQSEDHPITHVIMGPILYYVPKNTLDLRELTLFHYTKIEHPQAILQTLPRLNENLYGVLQLLYDLLFRRSLSREAFHDAIRQPRKLKYGKQVFDVMYNQREDDRNVYTYQEELRMLKAIQKGDSANARVYASILAGGRIGHMSEDRLRTSKYAFVSSIAIITRAVIETGVTIEHAYAMSDTYINKIDTEYDGNKLMRIFFDAIMDFCSLVKLSRHHHYPLWIRRCMQYMDQHLHTDLSLHEIGEYVHMSPSYISVQFKNITGKSIKQYINEQRVNEAKYLLITTNQSIQEIAMVLNFSTQSYFTKVFKEFTGEVPVAYRNRKQHS